MAFFSTRVNDFANKDDNLLVKPLQWGVMTTRAIASHDSKWFDNFVADIWTIRGACREYPGLPWAEDAAPGNGEQIIMAGICAGCPILLKCAEFAVYSREKRGVEGGFYAGVWIPWRNESDGGMSSANRDLKARSRTILRRLVREAHRAEQQRLSAIAANDED